jgi:cellulose synthase (UDP-forming)
MYPHSKSEDVWTSLILHERGWRTIFIRDWRSACSDTVEALPKQQLRWSDQRIQKLLTATTRSREASPHPRPAAMLTWR